MRQPPGSCRTCTCPPAQRCRSGGDGGGGVPAQAAPPLPPRTFGSQRRGQAPELATTCRRCGAHRPQYVPLPSPAKQFSARMRAAPRQRTHQRRTRRRKKPLSKIWAAQNCRHRRGISGAASVRRRRCASAAPRNGASSSASPTQAWAGAHSQVSPRRRHGLDSRIKNTEVRGSYQRRRPPGWAGWVPADDGGGSFMVVVRYVDLVESTMNPGIVVTLLMIQRLSPFMSSRTTATRRRPIGLATPGGPMPCQGQDSAACRSTQGKPTTRLYPSGQVAATARCRCKTIGASKTLLDLSQERTLHGRTDCQPILLRFIACGTRVSALKDRRAQS